MTALERMAKAVFESHQQQFRARHPLSEGATPDTTWSALAPDYKARHIEALRCGLSAIREADHDMTAAVVEPGDDRTETMQTWSRIVNAILKGEA